MNRFNQSSSTSIAHLISTYFSGNTQSITVFMEKRYTRFQEAEARSTYDEVYEAERSSQAPIPLPITPEQFIQKLEQLCVDRFYSHTLRGVLFALPQPKKSFLINYQLQETKKGTSYFFQINQILVARKHCLKSMKVLLQQTIKESIARLSELDKLCMILIHTRILTLLLVESIHEWNYSLGSLEEWKDIKYEQEGVEIFREICQDTDFLRDTLLKRYVRFAKGFDPLLIRISRKRKEMNLGNIGKIEDGDRFADFFQPDFNILSRLRQAENLLIKYHSLKASEIKDYYSPPKEVPQKPKQKDSFAEILTVQTKNIDTSVVLDLDNVKISLPKLVGPIKIRKGNPNRLIGTIIKHCEKQHSPDRCIEKQSSERSEKITKHQKERNEALTPLKPSANLLEKLRVLKQHYVDNNQLVFTVRNNTHRRESSSANLISSSKQLKPQIHIPPSPPLPTLSQTKKKSPPHHKRKKEKQQKLRFLKEVYRDKSRANTEAEMSLAKCRASQTIKKKRKCRGIISLNLKQKANLYSEPYLLKEKDKGKYFRQF